MMTEVYAIPHDRPVAANTPKHGCLPETPGKSSTCTLQSEPVYNHYLLAADSSRKVDRLGESARKSMDKIVISPNEITEIKETPDQPARIEPKLPHAIQWWARVSVGLLALGLPLLCLITILLIPSLAPVSVGVLASCLPLLCLVTI